VGEGEELQKQKKKMADAVLVEAAAAPAKVRKTKRTRPKAKGAGAGKPVDKPALKTPAKAVPKAVPKALPKAMPVRERSKESASSDSESSSSSSSDDGGDSDSDAEVPLAGSKRAAAEAPQHFKRPMPPKRPRGANGDAPPPPRDPREGLRTMIKTPFLMLNSDAIDALVTRMLAATAAREEVLFVSSMALQPVLGMHNRRDAITRETLLAKLGVDEARLARAQAIAVVVHGPATEHQKVVNGYARTGSVLPHWSLLCHVRGVDGWVHLDSMGDLNQDRACEITYVLERYNFLGPSETARRTLCTYPGLPTQTSFWECGYFVLLHIKIIADKHGRLPVADDYDGAYRGYVNGLHRGQDGDFQAYLLGLLDAE